MNHRLVIMLFSLGLTEKCRSHIQHLKLKYRSNAPVDRKQQMNNHKGSFVDFDLRIVTNVNIRYYSFCLISSLISWILAGDKMIISV
jgi:hypothetical protein